MNKKFAVFVILISIFFVSFRVHAIIIPPIFSINIHQHTIGGDDAFQFHIRSTTPPDPTTHVVDDFEILTENGEGSYETGGISANSTIFTLKQDPITGWQSPIISCNSSDPLVTTEVIERGVRIHGQGYSSIDCDVTDIKQSLKTPILFVPGVLGTNILKDSDRVWINLDKLINYFQDEFMDPLDFKIDLTPIDLNLTIGEVVGKIGVFFDYTDSLIQEFENQGYTQGTSSTDNLFLFPYDWRYGVSSNTINQLKQKIQDIKTQTGSEKVDVIAHSTGGLLVKKYVIDNPNNHSVNKAVFVGVPNTGAPQAVKVLLQGDNFGNPFLSDNEMKKLAKNFPVVYDLTPSEQYYNQKGSYIKVIDQNFFTATVKNLNFAESNHFLMDDHELNSQALSNAHNLHTTAFDNFNLTTLGVDLYSINGCKAGTLGKIIERRSHALFGDAVTYDQPEEVPGDGTVPLESATNLPIDPLKKFYALKADHGKMPSQDGIRQKIVNIISGSNISINENKITQDITKCKLNGKAISVYSPLDIEVIDQDGNLSGISDGNIFNDIPNADFKIIGEHKFVYIPNDEGQTYTINIKGTGEGAFTLKSSNIEDNNVTSAEVFSNIPVTTSLLGNLDITNSKLLLDNDGNGINDSMLTPITLNSDLSKDMIAPVTNLNITGTIGQDKFYRSNISLNFQSSDPVIDNLPNQVSGVLSTKYNLDETGYQNYINPINVNLEGEHTLKFFSTDNAGNNEMEQLATFTIDKTAPEFIIKFDLATKDLKFSGKDNISLQNNINVIDNDDIVTITDQAGNISQIKLKDSDRKHKLKAIMKSLSYNGIMSDISKVEMDFKWKFNSNNTIKSLNQYIKAKNNFNITAKYSPNHTEIDGRDSDGNISKNLNGIVLLNVMTEKGDIYWSY